MSAMSARGFHLSFLTCLRLYAASAAGKPIPLVQEDLEVPPFKQIVASWCPAGLTFPPPQKIYHLTASHLQLSSALPCHSGLQRIISALDCFEDEET